MTDVDLDLSPAAGEDPFVPEHCYDFPDVVLHRPECPRYQGGVCHPIELREPFDDGAMTDEVKVIVKTYLTLQVGAFLNDSTLRDRAIALGGVPIEPTGTTGDTQKGA